jgi:glycine betaine transporter
LNEQGVEHVLYQMFQQLPASALMVAFLLFVAFISFVTAADSSTDVIANLCSKGVTADSDLDGNPTLKIVWGVIIGTVSWVMVAFIGIDGVKMLSNLGGLPGMILVLLASTSLIFWLKNPALLEVKRQQPVSEPDVRDADPVAAYAR